MPDDIDNPELGPTDSADFDAAFEKVVGPDAEIQVDAPKTSPEAPSTGEAPITPKTPESSPEAKVRATETLPATSPSVPAPKTVPGDTEIEGIAPPKNISPRNMEGWNALKAKALQRGEEISKLKTELQEVQSKVGKLDPTIQERLNKAEEEATRLKMLYTNERDPEFVAKYDAKIQGNEETVLGILQKGGLSEENLGKIKQLGINGVPDAFWREHILPNVSIVEAKQIEQALADNAKLKGERTKALDDVKTNFKKYEEDLKAKDVQSYDVYRNEMGQTLTKLTDGLPWCRKQEIPANATAEQKELIEKQNEFYAQSEKRFEFALFPPNAPARVEVAFAACLSYKLADDLAKEAQRADAAEQRATELEKKFEAIKTAGITNRAGQASKQEPKNLMSDRMAMRNDDAIEAGLAELGV